MIYCLDSNVLIDVMKSLPSVTRRFRACDAGSLRVPEVVRAELLTGCLKSARPEAERAKVDFVLGVITLVPFGGDAVEHYAAIRSGLEATGNIIGPNDLLIAATARSLGAIMVTANAEEFSRVPGLVVENWR